MFGEPPQQLRQLGDIGGNAPRLVAPPRPRFSGGLGFGRFFLMT
jgi:hypothetical protein